jgi:hypothetical protein
MDTSVHVQNLGGKAWSDGGISRLRKSSKCFLRRQKMRLWMLAQSHGLKTMMKIGKNRENFRYR